MCFVNANVVIHLFYLDASVQTVNYGWDDVSYHGSEQVRTPNIDLLARSGVVLERLYAHCVCTPSRASLLTGKHAYTLGMQGHPLLQSEDRFLPLREKILPQYLKELGYSTHLVGKWHVGHSRTAALPTMRGFDSHFGHRGGYIDYYEYAKEETWSSGIVSGYDLHRNLTPAWDSVGYITDLYNKEAKTIIESHDTSSPLFLLVAHNAPHAGNAGAVLQAPPEEVRRMRHVESQQRRILAGSKPYWKCQIYHILLWNSSSSPAYIRHTLAQCGLGTSHTPLNFFADVCRFPHDVFLHRKANAMIKKLDDSVGDIVKSLFDKGILNNTIIVFTSDNGGMTSGNLLNYGSNWPLRGIKQSPYEGGVRIAGILWKENLNPESRAWNGYMHISDWLPTLLYAVGVDSPPDIDGFNLWDNIVKNAPSKRNEVVEIDDYYDFHMIISGQFKLIIGNVIKEYSNYQGQDLRRIIGNPPSYIDAIKKSTAYSLGLGLKIEDDELTRKYVVDCGNNEERDEILCYPENGTFCLYNIIEDPCETKDISKAHPEVVNELLRKLETEKNRTIPRIVPMFQEPRSHPNQFNYSWSTWADNIE